MESQKCRWIGHFSHAIRHDLAAFAKGALGANRLSESASPQPRRSFPRAEKFFATDGALGLATACSARKTRESVPLIRSDDAASSAFDGRQRHLRRRREPTSKCTP